ncbi:MAG TPA: LysM peptidoglycan-binding domain-containing protein [Candidatus Saccharimonadales bacterium]|nr:LysM peptidoglycan-binding domain-containing protein [Candidatus Saccharimonadales bacterium]
MVQVTTRLVAKVYAAPRLLRHAGMILMVGAVVLTGSTGHATGLNALADQTSSGAALDPAAAATVAATVASQTDLLVTPEADSNAQTLNAQISLPTSDNGTLAAPDVVNTSGATNPGVTTYTVQAGDTLQSIATDFDITSDTIVWANNLSASSSLTPGQQLTILPVSGVQYTVQAGDTPQSVAAHFQANADQILAFNNISGGLTPAQTIVVPDGVMPQQADAATPSVATTVPAGTAVSATTIDTPVGAGPGSISNSYAKGYCTWYVATKRTVPNDWGNAINWYGAAQASGYSVGTVPRPGAIAWSGVGYYGHVAYVESVSGSNVTISEMNWNGGWDKVDFRTVPASTFRYIY